MQNDTGRHRFSITATARLVDEVSIQGASGRRQVARPGHLPASLPRDGRRDHSGRALGALCPYVRVGAAEACDQRSRAPDEGLLLPQGPT